MTTFPVLYSRTSKGAINTWRVWTEGSTIYTEWGQVGGKLQQSEFVCSPKNVGKANATTAEEQAVLEAESLHKKQLRKKYSPTLEQAENNSDIKPMLAKSWEDQKHKLVYPVFGQEKLDGLRAMAYLKDGQVVLHSRGNKFYNLPHVQEALASLLKPGMVLDGELYRHGVSLQTINSLVRGHKKEATEIQYHIYDMVNDEPFSVRTKTLQDLHDAWTVPNMWCPIVLVNTVTLTSEDHVMQYQRGCVERGYEGCMVRSATGKYRYGYRSPDLLKCKTWRTEEFPILGHKTGKGRFENVPMLVCGLPDGQTFDVTPTGTMEQRKELLNSIEQFVGMLYTVKFFDYSPKGVPLYPSGVSVRIEEDLP